MANRIYLDHAATTPLRPQALAAVQDGFARWANPSSPHGEGRAAKIALEGARDRVKAALCWTGEVIFTGGASEALAVGLGRAKVDRQIASAVEHDAVFRAAPDATVVPLEPTALASELANPGKAVVAVQAVNSETGTDLRDSVGASVTGESGALWLADCSQSAGKLPLPDCDMAVVSAHKLGGPVGIGALLVRDFALLEPVGGHERGYRAGTENLPAALGFAAALEAGGLESWETTAQDRAAFHSAMQEMAQVQAFGAQCDYLFSIAHPTMSAQALLIRLDAMGFAVSAGSACSSGTLKKSRVLGAFGVADDVAARTVRVSMGWNTTPGELATFVGAWRDL
ncbi:MAG: aminotransferase class V-fold PLP-dependent enzyme [Parerythrobacter sp.]